MTTEEQSCSMKRASDSPVVVVPGVAWLLRPAALQLLHQHLAAPPQGVSDLPEGAAATQRAVPVLGRGEGKWKGLAVGTFERRLF